MAHPVQARGEQRSRRGSLLNIAGRIAAGVVVLALLSTATLAVRGAMEERRGRAEQAWREASRCALTAMARANSAHSAQANELRLCARTARDAADLALEMPEHGEKQWALQAALD